MGATARDVLRRVRPGPRVRMAARLYASGAVDSKRAACAAVGLHPQYLSMLDSAGNEVTRRVQDDIERAIEDQTVSLSRVIAMASRKAAKTINKLMDSSNEHIQLKASSDILDRNPETSKTVKAQVSSFSIDSADVAEIAKALVETARIKERLRDVDAKRDFVQVEVTSGAEEISGAGPSDTPGDKQVGAETSSTVSPVSDRSEGQATQGAQKVEFVLSAEEDE